MTLVPLCKRPDSENRNLSILSFTFLLIAHVGREQAAGLYYLACRKIQDIKDVLALLYIGKLGIVSMHGMYMGEMLRIPSRWSGRARVGSGASPVGLVARQG